MTADCLCIMRRCSILKLPVHTIAFCYPAAVCSVHLSELVHAEVNNLLAVGRFDPHITTRLLYQPAVILRVCLVFNPVWETARSSWMGDVGWVGDVWGGGREKSS